MLLPVFVETRKPQAPAIRQKLWGGDGLLLGYDFTVNYLYANSVCNSHSLTGIRCTSYCETHQLMIFFDYVVETTFHVEFSCFFTAQ